MTPFPAVDVTGNKKYSYMEQDACESLYQKLQSGIQSAKSGEVYTVEEAWEEIDKI